MNELLDLYVDGFPYDSKEFAKWFISNQNQENIITYRENDHLISGGYLVYKKIQLFSKKMNLPYISALATFAQYRGQNKVKNVIDKMFNTMYSRDDMVCFLQPFDYNYYKKFDFFDATMVKPTVINGGAQFEVREGNLDNLDDVLAIHQAMNKNLNSFIYDKEKVKELFISNGIDNGKLYIYYDSSHPFAYAFIQNGEIRLYGYTDYDKFMSINELKGKTFLYYQGEEPFIQGRIINVKKILSQNIYKPNIEGKIIIRVIDSIIKENNLTLSVFIEKGKGYVKETTDFPTKVYSISELGNNIFNGNRLFKGDIYNFQEKF